MIVRRLNWGGEQVWKPHSDQCWKKKVFYEIAHEIFASGFFSSLNNILKKFSSY